MNEISTTTTAAEENPALTAAQETVRKAQEAQEKEAQAAQEARERANEKLKALVKAFSKGEREYRSGLLEAGRLSNEYIRDRVALGDPRAQAIKAIEGQIAIYATDSVDINRLIRAYQAFRLLCEAQGMAKVSISYGHYRDCWSGLVQRTNKDTAQEDYVLLPGLEKDCLDAFAHCAKHGLSKQGTHEKVMEIKVKHQEILNDRIEKEAREKAAREKEAREKAARERQERLAADRAAQEASEKAQAARDKAEEEQTQEASEKAQAARKEAEAARKEAEAKRIADEQAARDEARAKEEAREAQRKLAEAEAKRKKEEEARAKKGKKGKSEQGETKEDPKEQRLPNLLASAKSATPKDCADMIRAMIQSNGDAPATLYEVIDALISNPSQSLDASTAVRTIFLALDRVKLPENMASAVNAARLVLNRKEKVA